MRMGLADLGTAGAARQENTVCALFALYADFCAVLNGISAVNAKNPLTRLSVKGFLVFSMRSLTITYFHTGIRTIIGVESFHGPVRDGKGWDRLAMVIRQRGELSGG